MSVAARWAGWDRRLRATMGPALAGAEPVTFPVTALSVMVEAAWGADLAADPATWTWTRVPGVRQADEITISRGGSDWASQAEPDEIQFDVNNPSGDLTPEYAAGAYYPYVRQNTPFRVSIDPGSGYRIRGTVFADSYTPGWDTALRAPTVSIKASGLLHRLKQGTAPVHSPIYGEMIRLAPVNYWPCEDLSGATAFAEFAGGPPLKWLGTAPTLASAGPGGSGDLPAFSSTTEGTGVVVNVPDYSGATFWQVVWVFRMPAAPNGGRSPMLELRPDGSTAFGWRFTLSPSGGTDQMMVEVWDTTGTNIVSDTTNFTVGTLTEPYGRDLMVTLSATQSGGNINWAYTITDCLTVQQSSRSGSVAGTLGKIRRILVPIGFDHSSMVFGHLALFNQAVSFNTAHLNGGVGDAAADRMADVADESGIGLDIVGTTSLTQAMGARPVDSPLSILGECADADGGILSDGLTGRLRYRTRESLYNQTPTLILDMAQGGIAPPFNPIYDDQRRRNDVTVSRTGGSSGRDMDVTGPLGTDAVGTYAHSLTLNVEDDDILPHQAGWLVNLGTARGMRYPTLSTNFARNPAAVGDWLGLDVGDVVRVVNLPPQHPAGEVDLIVEGWTEKIRKPREWSVTINCAPAEPWRVFTIEDSDLGRLASGASTLASGASAGATSLSVATTSGAKIWTTSATFPADFPLSVEIAGMEVEVTAISGSSSPQTFTVTGSTVTKDLAAGEAVEVWRPAVLAL